MHRGWVLVGATFAACGGDVGFSGDDDVPASDAAGLAGDGASAPIDAGPAGMALGSFKLTYYWVAAEDDFVGPADTTIYDKSCNAIATVPAKFADSLSLEGTGRLADGRLLNVNGSCMCAYSPCFFEADAAHPWGYGVQNRALVPYRSVAVDKTVLKIGARYYVAELDGVAMPGEPPWGQFVHDGCIQAVDVGGGIDNKHIDFFVGLKASYKVLDGVLGLTTVSLSEGGAHCP
jgi:3D (Asp-Asp-Asp) domain-containing protein